MIDFLWSDDPDLDRMRHEESVQEWLDKSPVCSFCGEPIQEDKALHILGEWFCQRCVEENTEYIEED